MATQIKLWMFFALLFLNHASISQNVQVKSKVNKIDKIARIGSDSITIWGADYSKVMDSIFFAQNSKDYKSVYLANKAGDKFMRCSGKQTDGYWSDYFTIGYSKRKNNLNGLRIKEIDFVANSFIKLGLSDSLVLKYFEMPPDCILVKGKRKILKFYWFDKESIYFPQYQIPQYVASFIFEKGKLIKFGFGNYLAELDKDFFPANYKKIKGKLYQY